MRRLTAEDGGVLPTVAIMFAALVAMSALVIDVGALFWEKRQLQNGADAGALAIAYDCAGGACGAFATKADTIADANANDTDANIDSVTFPGGSGQQAGSVRVATSTDAGGSAVVAPFVAQLFGDDGTTVNAVATAAWGAPSGLTSELPLTFSFCEFDHYSDTYGLAAPPIPPYPPAAQEAKIFFHDNSEQWAPGCENYAPDLPGGFGWLNTEDCIATTSADGWVDDKTGVAVPNDCSSGKVKKLESMVGNILHVPIYDETNGLSGTNGEYHILGYASFFMTGYRFPGNLKPSPVSGAPCANKETCISGFFTSDVLATTSGVPGSSPAMGVTIVGMTG